MTLSRRVTFRGIATDEAKPRRIAVRQNHRPRDHRAGEWTAANLVDTRDVVKRDANSFRIDRFARSASEQASAHGCPLPLEHPSIEEDQQQKRGDRNQKIP